MNRDKTLHDPKYSPKGPRTQITGFEGPNAYNINGIWALKPYYLGPWTLRVVIMSLRFLSL